MTFAIFSLAIVAAAILSAWYKPSWLKSFASFLILFADAIQAARSVLEGKSPRGKVVASISEVAQLTPVAQDVIEGLMAQGASKREAAAKVNRAVSELPKTATFDEIWRKAVAA